MFRGKSIIVAIIWLVTILVYIPTMSLAEETPLDQSIPPTETPTAPAKYVGPPTLGFYLSDEDYLLIKVDGFTFAGTDISELVGQYKEQQQFSL